MIDCLRTNTVATAAGLLLLFGSVAVADDDAMFSARVTATTLTIKGHTSSAAHGEILRSIIDRNFADRSHTIELLEGHIAPPGWSLLTAEVLRAIAALQSGEATVSPAGVSIRGLAPERDAWESARQGLQRTLLDDMPLTDNVAFIDQRTTFEKLCSRQWQSVLEDRRVEFTHSSTELTAAALPLLDALVEIAADCPGGHIVITGHTDVTGDDALNLAVSRARAEAVARYMSDRGIDAERITATGAGAAMPLDLDDTPAAHRRNRRIEIELSFRQAPGR